ncbi:MAG TPA: hypothetical protein VLA80_14375, partial [Actinomycetota bacterium]|nr:hypothetical protein [Actinomycetota bacterium]
MLLASWLAVAVALSAPATAAGVPVASDRPSTLHDASAAPAPGDGSSTSPYPHLGPAVAAARAGDTVLVGPG